jgi:hypothetical protein
MGPGDANLLFGMGAVLGGRSGAAKRLLSRSGLAIGATTTPPPLLLPLISPVSFINKKDSCREEIGCPFRPEANNEFGDRQLLPLVPGCVFEGLVRGCPKIESRLDEFGVVGLSKLSKVRGA